MLAMCHFYFCSLFGQVKLFGRRVHLELKLYLSFLHCPPMACLMHKHHSQDMTSAKKACATFYCSVAVHCNVVSSVAVAMMFQGVIQKIETSFPSRQGFLQ